jgi:hypothetical protein
LSSPSGVQGEISNAAVGEFLRRHQYLHPNKLKYIPESNYSAAAGLKMTALKAGTIALSSFRLTPSQEQANISIDSSDNSGML